jgi:hypothetical protein
MIKKIPQSKNIIARAVISLSPLLSLTLTLTNFWYRA